MRGQTSPYITRKAKRAAGPLVKALRLDQTLEVRMENEAHGLLSMPGVGFFGMLVIGILAGYIAEKVTASDHGLLTNLLVGVAGSFVGGSLATLLNISFYGWLGNFLVATVGAILILWLWRRFRGPSY